jgi:hypothetical protein
LPDFLIFSGDGKGRNLSKYLHCSRINMVLWEEELFVDRDLAFVIRYISVYASADFIKGICK